MPFNKHLTELETTLFKIMWKLSDNGHQALMHDDIRREAKKVGIAPRTISGVISSLNRKVWVYSVAFMDLGIEITCEGARQVGVEESMCNHPECSCQND
ncbi:MAG: hypothetical protein EOP06_05555 [Proteobacteria bacterium]|nr:MAG: hypothetical protein EOP06_05555 [Pseudomonadota bacterium]